MASYGWRPYVPVARRRAKAVRQVQKLRKNGIKIEPVVIEGGKIARTFWGEAWCHHLEQFSDYANRLPRGRTYVRNGSVCHLAIAEGKVEAIVSGSALYNIDIRIAPLPASKWKNVRRQCAGQIGSMLELLQGRFSNHVMKIVTDRSQGLFPQPREIKFSCDCPDWAVMCKHVAAVLYGVGARLDQQPELLFSLRNVDHEALITTELDVQAATSGKGKRRHLVTQDLANVFGVEFDEPLEPGRRKGSTANSAVKKHATAPAKKKSANRAGQKTTGRGKKPPPSTSTKASNKKAFSPTAASIARLRKTFGINQSQFAKLVGVSPPTVAHWENASGKLNLRRRTLEALTQVAGLTTTEATRKLRH